MAPVTLFSVLRRYNGALQSQRNYVPFAQIFLAAIYGYGESSQRDDVEAYKWLNLAAAYDKSETVEARERLEQRMTGEQIPEAQQRSSGLFVPGVRETSDT